MSATKKRPSPARAAPAQRWVTVEDAAERLPMRRELARRLVRLKLAEVVEFYDPDTAETYRYELVWLPRLAELGLGASARDQGTGDRDQAPQPAPSKRLPLALSA